MKKYSILLFFLINTHSQLVLSSNTHSHFVLGTKINRPIKRSGKYWSRFATRDQMDGIIPQRTLHPSPVNCSSDELLALIQTETLKDIYENIDNTHIFKAMTPDSINRIYPLHEAIKRWVLCENNFKTLDRIENNYFIHIMRIAGMIVILRQNKADIWLKKNGQTPLEFFESEIICNHLDGNQFESEIIRHQLDGNQAI